MPERSTDPRLSESEPNNSESSDAGSFELDPEATSQMYPLPSSMPTGVDQPPTEPEDDVNASAYARDLFGPSHAPGLLGQLMHYNVLRLIGRGAMGLVFQAFDTKLQRIVAIKILAAHLASSPTAKRRFHREARAAAAINHPNVVTVFSVDEHKGVPYLVTEYISGGSLSQAIRARAPIEPERVARLGAQLAHGLAEAHARGVIHRDVKPANLLLEDCGDRIKISDFGLAQAVLDPSESASPGQHAGTPTYMAPEIIAGESATPRSDLFSLGCVLYAMVEGRSPFFGRNFPEVARKIENEHPRPLTEIDPRIPPNLAAIIHGLLEKSPEVRTPPTAARLAEALQTFENPHRPYVPPVPIPAKNPEPPPSPPEKPSQAAPPRKPRRRAALFTGVAAVCLGLLSAAIWWPWFPGDDGGAKVLSVGKNCPWYGQGERLVLESGLPWLRGASTDAQGRLIVMGGGWDTRARVWDREAGRILTLLDGHESWIQAVDISSDGKTIATGSGGTWKRQDGRREGGVDFSVRVWPLDGQYPNFQFTGHTEPVTTVKLSPNRQFVASASRDHTIRVWSLKENHATLQLNSPAEVLSLAYDPSGRRLLSGSWDQATLWDLSTGNVVQDLDCSPGPVLAVDISPDGRTAATATKDGPTLIWNLENLDVPARELPHQDGWVNAVAFSPDGTILLTACSDGQIHLWEPTSRREQGVFRGTHAAATSVGFCRQATEVVAAYEDGTVRVWKVPDLPDSP